MRPPTQEELVDTIGEVRWIIGRQNFTALRRVICHMAWNDECHEQSILAALRTAYTARSKIPAWDALVGEAELTFKRRGLDAEQLLRGLT